MKTQGKTPVRNQVKRSVMKLMNEKVKILVVDDEPCVRELLAQFLTQEGYVCVAVEDGDCALKKVEAEYIPVVILDILIPGLNGITLLHEVKKRKPFTEVIMVTGVTDIAKAVEAMRLGAAKLPIKTRFVARDEQLGE